MMKYSRSGMTSSSFSLLLTQGSSMILTRIFFVTISVISVSAMPSPSSLRDLLLLTHTNASSTSLDVSSTSLGNYSFPDSPEAFRAGQVINDTSSIIDADGHHMHVMEGDIAVVDDEENEIEQNGEPLISNGKKAKYAVNNNFRVWPSGRIPYVIDGSLWNSRGKILNAMRHIESKTCITFYPRRNNDKNYIRIFQGGHRSCYSMIGRMGGTQGISLGNGCLIHGVIVHELMHAVGFYHMHSRSDRDNYLKILWNNINGNMQSQFRKNSPNQDQIFRPFDYDSIMLYGPKLFSSNGGDTMIPRKRGIRLLDTGVKRGLSDEDARSINILYGCSKRGSPDKRIPDREIEDRESVSSSTTTVSPKKTTTVKKFVNKPRRKSFNVPQNPVRPRKKTWTTVNKKRFHRGRLVEAEEDTASENE